jgi:hypothetical protein
MAAIDMALADAITTIKNVPRDNPTVVILSDCQEAINTAQIKNRKTIYAHCKESIDENMKTLKKLKTEVIIEWVPGHSGTEGNELADGIAKRCLQRIRQDDIKNIYEVPREATKSSVKAAMNTVWQMWWNRWDHTRSYTVMREVGRESPLRHAGKLTKREETVLTRLRVGNATHHGSLYKTKRYATPDCQCGAPDSAEHRIFDCSQYNQQRTALLATLAKHNVKPNIYAMMGFDGKSADETKDIIMALAIFK